MARLRPARLKELAALIKRDPGPTYGSGPTNARGWRSLMDDGNMKVLPPLKVEHYQDEHGDWRWRAIAPEDGLLMANGGQGYTHEQDCINGAKRVTHIESVLNPDIS